MDEPCSALDPISMLAVEDLINELKDEYTIVIVTHNMQQVARASESPSPEDGETRPCTAQPRHVRQPAGQHGSPDTSSTRRWAWLILVAPQRSASASASFCS